MKFSQIFILILIAYLYYGHLLNKAFLKKKNYSILDLYIFLTINTFPELSNLLIGHPILHSYGQPNGPIFIKTGIKVPWTKTGWFTCKTFFNLLHFQDAFNWKSPNVVVYCLNTHKILLLIPSNVQTLEINFTRLL